MRWKVENKPVYLGDSVYVVIENGMIKLFTDNGYGPRDVIYLEGEVWEMLKVWVENIIEKNKRKE